MLIDVNANIGHWPFKQLKYNTCSALLERMNRFGVDISVISNINAVFYKNVQSANDELYNEIKSSKKFGDRFIPFAVINPIYAGWKDDLEKCRRKMGIKGIRIYPVYHDYDLGHPSCIELVKRARDYDLPVALTLRMVDARQRSWMDVSEEWTLRSVIPILKEVPDAKYLVLNLANSLSLNAQEMEIIKKCDFLFDTSGRMMTDPGSLLKTYGTNRISFGTHAPFLDYLAGLLRIESLRENEAGKEIKEMLRSGNARRFLKI